MFSRLSIAFFQLSELSIEFSKLLWYSYCG
nr:MAG TPA: hypothetical protein [Caudoviricetes sp.]